MSHLSTPGTAPGTASGRPSGARSLSGALPPPGPAVPTAAPAAGSIRLKDAGLVGPCHACAFFSAPEEEYRVLLPFAVDCAHCSERCLQYLDPAHVQDRYERLANAGIDVARASDTGHLELRTWDDVYLRGGQFEADGMLALIEDTLRRGRPFSRTRLWANMGWALQGLPGSDQLTEYESRLNPILERTNDVVICAYEHGRYSAAVVLDILRAHPLVLVGDVLQPNPLYVPTERFLEDLRQRRAARPGLRSTGSRTKMI